MSIGLPIARLAYGIIPAGSLLTIYIFAAVYLLAVLGLGLLVSTFTATQQQAMLISFFMMMVFILLGGFIHFDRQYARYGRNGITRVKPGFLFYRSNADGGAKGKRIGRH